MVYGYVCARFQHVISIMHVCNTLYPFYPTFGVHVVSWFTGRQVDGSQMVDNNLSINLHVILPSNVLPFKWLSFGLVTFSILSLYTHNAAFCYIFFHWSVDLLFLLPFRVSTLIWLALGLGMRPAPTLYIHNARLQHVIPFISYIWRTLGILVYKSAGRRKSKSSVSQVDNNLSINQHVILPTNVLFLWAIYVLDSITLPVYP